MASAHKRLVDAGYVDKNMLVQPDDDNDEEQTKVLFNPSYEQKLSYNFTFN